MFQNKHKPINMYFKHGNQAEYSGKVSTSSQLAIPSDVKTLYVTILFQCPLSVIIDSAIINKHQYPTEIKKRNIETLITSVIPFLIDSFTTEVGPSNPIPSWTPQLLEYISIEFNLQLRELASLDGSELYPSINLKTETQKNILHLLKSVLCSI